MAVAVVAVVLGFVLVPATRAQLTDPRAAYVSGSIAIDGVAVRSSSVDVVGAPGVATVTTSGPTYHAVVSMPAAPTASYTVYAAAALPHGWFAFAPKTVTASAGKTVTVDFRVAPGTVRATVSSLAGTLSAVTVYWYSTGGGGSGSMHAAIKAGRARADVPVAPGTLDVYGYARFADGSEARLGYRPLAVGPGATTGVEWEVSPLSGTKGVIALSPGA